MKKTNEYSLIKTKNSESSMNWKYFNENFLCFCFCDYVQIFMCDLENWKEICINWKKKEKMCSWILYFMFFASLWRVEHKLRHLLGRHSNAELTGNSNFRRDIVRLRRFSEGFSIQPDDQKADTIYGQTLQLSVPSALSWLLVKRSSCKKRGIRNSLYSVSNTNSTFYWYIFRLSACGTLLLNFNLIYYLGCFASFEILVSIIIKFAIL